MYCINSINDWMDDIDLNTRYGFRWFDNFLLSILVTPIAVMYVACVEEYAASLFFSVGFLIFNFSM